MLERKLELPVGVPPLNTYYAYLTGGCNLACQHCYLTPAYQMHGGTGGHLDYDLFALALEQGMPLGLRSVKLTGGEPLLHPDFLRFVDLIREKELGLMIETNGTLVTVEIAHYLKEKGTLNNISISLDGATAETHDAFRGVRGSFESAVQGIRYLVDVGLHPQVIMSIHKNNAAEIESLVHLAEGLGASSVKFNLIQPSGRGEKMIERGQVFDIQHLIELGNWVEGILQKQTSLPLHYSWPIAFRKLSSLLRQVNGSLCGIMGILGILHTGQLAVCGVGTHIPELCYGILGKDSVANVWIENPGLKSLRVSIPVALDGVCGQCIHREICMGACVAENYHATGRFGASYWFCQRAYETALFPISRLAVLNNDAAD